MGSLRVFEGSSRISVVVLCRGVFQHEAYFSSSALLSAVSANNGGDFDDLLWNSVIEQKPTEGFNKAYGVYFFWRAVWCPLEVWEHFQQDFTTKICK